MGSQLVFVTGGTTGVPRMVMHDAARWKQAIETKAELFRAYGVDRQSRVAVFHPFGPWSIGQVHVEAALACGATVFPLGLNLESADFRALLTTFMPTHAFGGLRYLARWLPECGGAFRALRGVFVAGAPVTEDMRRHAMTQLACPVVDIYGMAQFDMVGANLPGGEGLTLVPVFEYSLIDENGTKRSLELGATGDLGIRRPGSEWHRSGDIVEVQGIGSWPSADGKPTYRVRVIGRATLAITLADGSCLTEVQVRELLETKYPQVRELQIQLRRAAVGDVLEVLCVPENGAVVDLETLSQDVISANVDIRDSFKAGVASKCNARLARPEELYVTARGKVPLVHEVPA